VARNDDGVVIRRSEIGVGRCDRAIDAAAGRIVDEGINAVPESIADVNDVGLRKRDGDVAVGMRGPVIFQTYRRAVELQIVLLCKNFARYPTCGQCEEIVIPILDALHF
jgi:hypothetical protein